MFNPINWFEIPVVDFDRAKNFYAKVFGAEFQVMEMFGMQMAMFNMSQEAHGAGGALVKSDQMKPSTEGTLVYFYCPEDLQVQLDRIKENGGSVANEKTPLGGEMGFIGHAIDTEGNLIGLHSMK
jgi:predicted enzyme related to lactoylglutathione lyase